MNLLAIDTSSNACSVAVQFDGQVTENHVIEPSVITSYSIHYTKLYELDFRRYWQWRNCSANARNASY